MIGRKALESAQRELAGLLEIALDRMFGKRVGFTLFLFNFNDQDNAGGFSSYISNTRREDMIHVVREWLARQDAGLSTDPAGPTPKG